MKRKTLITGARPRPFEGPWVVLDKNLDWSIEGEQPGIVVEKETTPERIRVRASIVRDLDVEGRISVFAVAEAA